MAKKSFPGMMSETEIYAKQQQKIAEREAAKKQREQRRAERKEFNRKIGPAAHLAIARRGLATFVACALLGVGIGSAAWAIAEKDEISHLDAFKRAYNINNLATEDAIYPIVAILLLVAAAGVAFGRAGKYKRDVKQLVKNLDSAIDPYTKDCVPWWIDRITRAIFKDIEFQNGSEHINAVQRAIIKKYVSENPIMFDRVLSYNGAGNDKMNPAYAMTVIKTHLEKHPEDYKKLLDAYDEASIPWSLVRKYGEKKR